MDAIIHKGRVFPIVAQVTGPNGVSLTVYDGQSVSELTERPQMGRDQFAECYDAAGLVRSAAELAKRCKIELNEATLIWRYRIDQMAKEST